MGPVRGHRHHALTSAWHGGMDDGLGDKEAYCCSRPAMPLTALA